LLGCVFLGAAFDYISIIASIRNQGKSLGQIAREFMGVFSYRVFLGFLLIILMYILIVFVDMTAGTFAPLSEDAVQQGGIVATSSLLYIGLALVFGLALRYSGLSSNQLTFIFVPFIFVIIWLSTHIPLTSEVVSKLDFAPQKTWTVVLLIYCVFASVLPVWVLLQPRDFLSSFLLYACLLGGILGIVAVGISGKYSIEYPSFITFNSETLGPIFPIMFVTIACGAISGFHCLVAMGTTSKQLDRVCDARPIDMEEFC
jgi:carbon starvation protein